VEEQEVRALARRLVEVPGVVGVVLGGSRARGTHRPDSDVDLGLYYRGPLAVPHLRALAQEVTGTPTEVTEPGGWGPWVNGGGWLTVDGWRVDWIYRDLDRVRRVWRDCQAGRYEVGFQPRLVGGSDRILAVGGRLPMRPSAQVGATRGKVAVSDRPHHLMKSRAASWLFIGPVRRPTSQTTAERYGFAS
jgi:hypothetical protein